LEKALWTLSGERTKNGEPHAVPLPQLAIELLRSIPKSEVPGPFLFSNSFGERPLVDFAWAKRHIDGRMAEIFDAGIPPWTLHDLRRTMRTGLATLGVPPHIAELCIGHKQRGIAAVYDQHRYEREKRHALEQWAAQLLLIANPSDQKNVVSPRHTPA
jgi:integrase